MLDDVRNYVRAGLEAMGAQGTDAFSSAVAPRARALAEQLSSLASGFLEWSSEARASLVTELRLVIADQIREMGLASKQDVRKLQERIERLEQTRPRPGTKRSGSTSAKRAASAKTPARAARSSTSTAGAKRAASPAGRARASGSSRAQAASSGTGRGRSGGARPSA